MRKTKFIFFSALFALIIVSSCKKEDPIVEADLLSQEVESVVAISNLPSYITATELYSEITAQQAPYMIDIRGAADFSSGHIEGAVNVAASDLLSHVETNVSNMSDEIVVICYSGQSAAFGSALLKLSGYTNVKSLKFGMTSWHSDFDS
ncbi:MAG: rhodanese-like domain-containing protein [Bacteroidales bacterium]|nr:rhodanese-like domain-containing protein [Bacteroidales bacterium]